MQLKKASYPSIFKPLGSWTDFKDQQSLNASWLILTKSSEEDKSNSCKSWQWQKALPPIWVTFFGTVKLFNFLHPKKAPSPI